MNDLWDGNYYKHHSEFQQSAALESLKEFLLKGNERVLDIGCGPGTISKQIAERVPHGKVIGIDPSMKMLSQAINDYRDIPNLQFFCQKAEDFQFDEPFHAITSFYSLHFVKNQTQAFERIKSALIPKGRLLFHMGSQPHPHFKEVFDRPRWHSTFHVEETFFPLSLDQAKSLLTSLGFILMRAEIDTNPFFFSSPEVLTKWLMGWLCHASALSKDPLTELATEITENICLKENRRTHIPLTIYSLHIEAYLHH